jgi:endonuclease III
VSEKRYSQTGNIWRNNPRRRGQVIRRVCEALEKDYGTPRLGNPKDPIDDLVYIIISNKTAPKIAERTYKSIKQAYKSWDELLASPISTMYAILKPAGLSKVKAKQLRGAFRRIKKDFGFISLHQLKDRDKEEIERYLVSLPGVSEKVAKCVMLYTLDKKVLPVDSHVHRISKRLGLTARRRADQSHTELEALIPSKRRFAFHVDCILHGRTICRPNNPNCDTCAINHHCEYYRNINS